MVKLPRGIILREDGSFGLAEKIKNPRPLLEWLGRNLVKVGENIWIEEPSLVEKAGSFIKAVLGKTVTEDAFTSRKLICLACPALDTSSKGDYCGACRCGRNRLSELNTKLKMANAKCPLKRW